VYTDNLVSIVTSVFNGERFLAQAIESVLRQSFRDFEFIIIDDGSTDSTGSILERYSQQDERIRVFKQENLGLIASLNRGCRLASGQYIARMDGDDVALAERLEKQVEFMKANPSIGLLGGAVEFISAQGQPLSISGNPTTDTEIRKALKYSSPFWHPTVMMRREAFELVGGYRMAFVQAEDYDMWLRIAENFKVANLSTVLVQYRLHPHQVSVLHRKKQIISSLAARASADERAKGNLDPFDAVEHITDDLLTSLGISESVQQKELIENYVWTIRNMCNTGEYQTASALMLQLQRSQEANRLESRTDADLSLLAARIYLDEARVWKALASVVRALFLRPLIFGSLVLQVVGWTRKRNLTVVRRNATS